VRRIDPPLEGIWKGIWPEPLPSVVNLRGRTFRRARLAEPSPGILAQYREHRARDSMHLYVLEDGTWSIDHVDAFNPDVGPLAAVRHFFADHPLGGIFSGAGR